MLLELNIFQLSLNGKDREEQPQLAEDAEGAQDPAGEAAQEAGVAKEAQEVEEPSEEDVQSLIGEAAVLPEG